MNMQMSVLMKKIYLGVFNFLYVLHENHPLTIPRKIWKCIFSKARNSDLYKTLKTSMSQEETEYVSALMKYQTTPHVPRTNISCVIVS